MSPKMHNKHALVLVSSTVNMYEIMSCFITGSHIWIWKPIIFSWDVALWQKLNKIIQIEMTITKYKSHFNKDVTFFTKFNVSILKT